MHVYICPFILPTEETEKRAQFQFVSHIKIMTLISKEKQLIMKLSLSYNMKTINWILFFLPLR